MFLHIIIDYKNFIYSRNFERFQFLVQSLVILSNNFIIFNKHVNYQNFIEMVMREILKHSVFTHDEANFMNNINSANNWTINIIWNKSFHGIRFFVEST